MRKTILVLAMLLMAAGLAAADTIYLKDGRTVRGTVIGFVNNRFAVRVDPAQTSPAPGTNEGGEIRFFRPAEVDRVEVEGRSLDAVRSDTHTLQVSRGPNRLRTGT